MSGTPVCSVPSASSLMVERLVESLAVVSEGPSTRPGLMVSSSQRDCALAISQALRSAATFE